LGAVGYFFTFFGLHNSVEAFAVFGSDGGSFFRSDAPNLRQLLCHPVEVARVIALTTEGLQRHMLFLLVVFDNLSEVSNKRARQSLYIDRRSVT